MKKVDISKRKFIKTIFGTFIFANILFCSACSKQSAKINHKKCVKCRLCESVCPHDAISYEHDKIKINKSKCTGCSQCVNTCVYGAISIS